MNAQVPVSCSSRGRVLFPPAHGRSAVFSQNITLASGQCGNKTGVVWMGSEDGKTRPLPCVCTAFVTKTVRTSRPRRLYLYGRGGCQPPGFPRSKSRLEPASAGEPVPVLPWAIALSSNTTPFVGFQMRQFILDIEFQKGGETQFVGTVRAKTVPLPLCVPLASWLRQCLFLRLPGAVGRDRTCGRAQGRVSSQQLPAVGTP